MFFKQKTAYEMRISDWSADVCTSDLPANAEHYALPEMLWLLCLPLIYWLNRIWMLARRGEVEGDPVAFAITDGRSLFVGAATAGIFLAALYGPAAVPLIAACGRGTGPGDRTSAVKGKSVFGHGRTGERRVK